MKFRGNEKELVERLHSEAKSQRVRLYDDELPKAVIPKVIDLDTYPSLSKLKKIDQRFVHKYTSHYNKARAAIEAGYRPAKAHITAHELLQIPTVKEAVAEIERDRLRRMKIDGDYVLAKIVQIALADPSELVEVWVPPCRYCWGTNHEYHRTFGEFNEDFEAYCKSSMRNKPPFEEKGGDGYDTNQPPNPECPNCFGRGLSESPLVHFKDSRFLSPGAKAIYAGAKKTKSGFELLMRDQSAAMGFLQRFSERLLELRQHENEKRIELQIPMASINDGNFKINRIERIIVDSTIIDAESIPTSPEESSV